MDFDSKKETVYRWNVNINKWEYWFDKSPSTWNHGWRIVNGNDIHKIPKDILDRTELLRKRKAKPTDEVMPELPITKPKLDIPLIDAYHAVQSYLFYNNYPQTTNRIKVINKLLDPYTKFADLKNPFTKDQSIYHQQLTILDFIIEYLNTYNQDAVLKNRYTYFHKLLNEINTYLIMAKDYDKSYVITDYKDKRDLKRLIHVEAKINDNATDEEMESFQFDNLFGKNSALSEHIKTISTIPDKAGKKSKGFSWEEINCIKTNLDEMNDEERELYHLIESTSKLLEYPDLSRTTKKKLNQCIADLRLKWNLLHISSNKTIMQVHRSNTAKRIAISEDDLADIIIEMFDFTNSLHIAALIENYFDLKNKHQNNAGHPIYSILQEFDKHIVNVKLKPEHRLILNAFMFDSSDKKMNAYKLNTTTEKMMRTLKESISKNISKYYSKYVGK